MENRIDADLSKENLDKILDLLAQARALLPFSADLSPEDRKTLFKMGESGRPFVEASLSIVEQDDSFMPRSFDKTEMRQDNALYEAMLPIYIAMTPLYEAVQDTLMLVGSDLIVAALDVYRNAKANGKGENLDTLVPLMGRRFKQKARKKTDPDTDGGDSTPTE